ncbi:hypothetical protein PUN28_003142 [Cardiocondyla obscurior]|uniref:Uncharacterized protein n=1 Tax=Cardiocondyla obscurior TaxID=286306 RepID=A0AAW2GHF8_9HYME
MSRFKHRRGISRSFPHLRLTRILWITLHLARFDLISPLAGFTRQRTSVCRAYGGTFHLYTRTPRNPGGKTEEERECTQFFPRKVFLGLRRRDVPGPLSRVLEIGPTDVHSSRRGREKRDAPRRNEVNGVRRTHEEDERLSGFGLT